MRFEIELKIPAGFRLIGTRTKGDKVIAVCEYVVQKLPEPQKPRRPIGYLNYERPAGDKNNE